LVVLSQRSGLPRALHSFPTRRSSDLSSDDALTRRADRGSHQECSSVFDELGDPLDVAWARLLRVVQRNHAHGNLLSGALAPVLLDRKSTRLNSSHDQISYAVFCLKKK